MQTSNEGNLILELKKRKKEAVKDTSQFLYNKRLLDTFESQDKEILILIYRDDYLLGKYGEEIKILDGVYYISDLDYSTRQVVLVFKKR